jgi:WD40 repeat protein/serine/threonine protein kinase
MDTHDASRDPVEELAEEFVGRCRRGERPALTEYTDRYPEHADAIRVLFPALVKLEQLKPDTDEAPADDEPVSSRLPQPKLVGDFRILREIGRGGMGVVYEAEQVSLGRHVALKVLPGSAVLDGRNLRRFQREAKAAARLHHTNVVPVHGVGETDGVHYYVMQFIQGQGLDLVLNELRRLRQAGRLAGPGPETLCVLPGAASASAVARALANGRFSLASSVGPAAEASAAADPTPVSLPGQGEGSTWTESGRAYWQSVARVGIQVADALGYAAGQGVLHRDVKPSNLLLDTQGNVWVTDFGLAKAETDGDDLTHTGDVVGTLRYMAPERFGRKGDLRSDLYSLGLTLYELATLRTAFDATDRSALLRQVMHEEPPRPRKVDPAVPRDLETIILKAIARDPERRYQTAAELAEDLRRFVDDKPIRARRVSGPERLWRWCRRNPELAAALAAVVVVFLAGFAGVTWKWQEASRNADQAQRNADLARSNAREAERQSKAAAAGQARAEEAGRAADKARRDSQRQSVDLLLDRGLALAEQGEAQQGLHWMLESIRQAAPDENEFRRMARTNVAAWSTQVPRLRHIFRVPPPQAKVVGARPDGRALLLDTGQGTLQLWDVATGERLCPPMHYTAPVTGAAFRPDGRMLAVGYTDGTVRLWDPATGRLLGEPPFCPGQALAGVEFMPDGKGLLILGLRGDVSLWQPFLTPRTLARTFRHGKELWRGVPSPDGTLLATYGAGLLRLWETVSGRMLAEVEIQATYGASVAFHPDSRHLLTTGGEDRTARVWAWDGKALRPDGMPLPHPQSVDMGSFLPDGATAVTGCRDGTVRFWDLGSRRLVGALPAQSRSLSGLSLSPDGRALLVISYLDATVRLWDLAPRRFSPDTFLRPGQESGDPWQTRFDKALISPDRRAVLLAGYAGLARLVDPRSGEPIGPPLRHPWPIVLGLAFSPDGTRIVTSSHERQTLNTTVQIWDAATGRPLRSLPHRNWVTASAFRPDGKVLATGGYDAAVYLWDVATGKQLGPPLPQGDIVWSLAFSPDGTRLAVGTTDDYSHKAWVRLWDVSALTLPSASAPRGGRVKQIGTGLAQPGWVGLVEFSPDGKTLLSAATHGNHFLQVRVSDAASGRPLYPALAPGVRFTAAAAFSPDSRYLLLADQENKVKLWDVATGRPKPGVVLREAAPVQAVAFHPDRESGTVVLGLGDGSARLWDLATCKPLGPPVRHGAPVLAVAFAADGRSFLSAATDGSVQAAAVPTAPEADVELLAQRVRVQTGMHLTADQAVEPLDPAAWEEQRRDLERHDGHDANADDSLAWHAAGAREAERDGSPAATRWHLERLITLAKKAAGPVEPGGPASSFWLLFARKARAERSLGATVQAEADHAEAVRLAPAGRLADWDAQQAVDCLALGDRSAALWYLDHTLAAEPKRWQFYELRAEVYHGLGKERRSERDADQVRAVNLGMDAAFVLRLAEERVAEGRWSEALPLYGRASRAVSVPLEKAALVCLKAGDTDQYRQLCRTVVAQARTTKDGDAARFVAELCTLGPDAVSDWKNVVALAERALAGARPDARHGALTTLGAVLYRAGRYPEALARLQEASRQPGEDVRARLFLALAHHRAGHASEARTWLARAAEVRSAAAAGFWQAVADDLLRQEARQLIVDKNAAPQ